MLSEDVILRSENEVQRQWFHQYLEEPGNQEALDHAITLLHLEDDEIHCLEQKKAIALVVDFLLLVSVGYPLAPDNNGKGGRTERLLHYLNCHPGILTVRLEDVSRTLYSTGNQRTAMAVNLRRIAGFIGIIPLVDQKRYDVAIPPAAYQLTEADIAGVSQCPVNGLVISGLIAVELIPFLRDGLSIASGLPRSVYSVYNMFFEVIAEFLPNLDKSNFLNDDIALFCPMPKHGVDEDRIQEIGFIWEDARVDAAGSRVYVFRFKDLHSPRISPVRAIQMTRTVAAIINAQKSLVKHPSFRR